MSAKSKGWILTMRPYPATISWTFLKNILTKTISGTLNGQSTKLWYSKGIQIISWESQSMLSVDLQSTYRMWIINMKIIIRRWLGMVTLAGDWFLIWRYPERLIKLGGSYITYIVF